MISKAYRALNAEMHREKKHYGADGARWAFVVFGIGAAVGARSVLDYGCGKGGLSKSLSVLNGGWRFQDYDPAIPGKDGPPEPADLVICTDVLEHIEPDQLDAVLDDLRRCTLKRVFLAVATEPANKTLPDGRNAHLLVEGVSWWLPRLQARWRVLGALTSKGGFIFVGAGG